MRQIVFPKDNSIITENEKTKFKIPQENLELLFRPPKTLRKAKKVTFAAHIMLLTILHPII